MMTSWPARAARTPPLRPCPRARARSAGPRCYAHPALLWPRASGRSALARPLPSLPHPSRAEHRRARIAACALGRQHSRQTRATRRRRRAAGQATRRRPRDRTSQANSTPAAAPSGAATCRASAGQAGGRRRGGRARQDMTTAPGDSPPSRISSQPTRRRPRARRNALTRPTNQDCSPNSSARPCSARRAWQRAQPCQRSLGHCARAARPLRAPRARARAAPGPDRGLDHPPCAAGAAAGEAAPGRPPAQRSADLRAAGAYA